MHLEKSQQIRNETQIVPKMLAMLNHFFKKKKKEKVQTCCWFLVFHKTKKVILYFLVWKYRMTLFFRHPFLCIIMQSEILIYVFFCLEFKSVIYTNISDGILHILKYIYNLEKIVDFAGSSIVAM